jgi:hypothetical protein
VKPLQDAAIVQVVLEGVALPANKRELLAYARKQRPPSSALAALEQIPERTYRTIDEVGEAIAQTNANNRRVRGALAEGGSGWRVRVFFCLEVPPMLALPFRDARGRTAGERWARDSHRP